MENTDSRETTEKSIPENKQKRALGKKSGPQKRRKKRILRLSKKKI